MSERTYIIAEAGVNHDGSVNDALKLVDAAAASGADCVKFQTFRADALASARADKADYQKRTSDAQESQRAMLARLELPREAYPVLRARADERGIDFLSTPFDSASLQFLLDLGLRRLKVGSGDLTNAPLLLEMAKADRDIILSTGMATLGEIEDAVSVIAFGYGRSSAEPSRAAFAAALSDGDVWAKVVTKVVLLQCTTEYPAPAQSVNLRAMETLRVAFGLPVGCSDHTLGCEIAIAAVARGAAVIEKHLTLDRTRQGPDHAASLEPDEFKSMVDSIRMVETALGDGRKVPQEVEHKNMSIARKSLVAACPIAKGEVFSVQNLAVKRPASGLAPIFFWDVVGRPARRAYQTDEYVEL